MTTYLVTGATGLIGRHFVRELLARPGVDRVALLVRAASQERASEAWSGAPKVRLVVGDISAPGLGIDPADRAELAGVDHVVHLAALYDVTADDESSVLANVEGTRNVVDLAGELAAGCLHHVSSVAVAGDYRGRFTEEMFDAGQRLVTPYHRTKFESERLVRAQRRVPWRVYRPAIVVGHSRTGEMDKVDGPYYFLPALARLRRLRQVPLVLPDIGDTNIVPVDYVAKAMVHLVHEPGLDGRAFHLVSPRPQSAMEVYNAFARPAGAPLALVGLPRALSSPLLGLARAAENIPGVSLGVDAVLDRLGIPPVLLTTLTFAPVFDSTATRRALEGSGIEVPALASYAPVLWAYWAERPARSTQTGWRAWSNSKTPHASTAT